MCKKCEGIERKLRKSLEANQKIARQVQSWRFWYFQTTDELKSQADFWHGLATDRGNDIYGDIGFIVGKESLEPSPKETPKPKRKKRVGTKTEIKKFRALLDNPKTLWEDLNGLEGGVQ